MAAANGAERGDVPEIHEDPVTDGHRLHWAFQPLRRPVVPSIADSTWPTGPIDCYILNRLETEGIQPLPPADRATLLRRLTFDLIGLPPTPEATDTFVNDPSPDAYQRAVDRLLASPHYGERRAQHWLDLARFAETDGFEHDRTRPEVWRYRDWVINALNRDMPYDQFVQLQLAGDELQPNSNDARIATSFCLSGPDMPDINSMDERKHNLLNEITGTVGSALLGLQIGCAQCHDHKFDPISQADFYRLRAIFDPAIELKKDKSVSFLHQSSGKPPISYFMIRGDWQRPGLPVRPAFPRIANPWDDQLPAKPKGDSPDRRRAALAHWITREDQMLTTRVIVNRLWQYHFGEGLSRSPSDFGVMGQEPSHPELLDWLATDLVRRQWSLKALDQLIVTSATYQQAGHASILGWSEEQRRDAHFRWQTSRKTDPENRLLARFPRRRLEGEAIRDALLRCAGVLNTAAGGPGVRPPLPRELVDTLLRNQWDVSPSEADHVRRSIYIFARRNLRYPILEAFDRPDGNASCPQRSRSTTAPQSLLMLNSEFSLVTARRLAGSVLTHAMGDPEEQIRQAFRRTLGRYPTPNELGRSSQFLDRQTNLLLDEQRTPRGLALPIPFSDENSPQRAAALTDFCLALLNSNEFIYVD